MILTGQRANGLTTLPGNRLTDQVHFTILPALCTDVVSYRLSGFLL